MNRRDFLKLAAIAAAPIPTGLKLFDMPVSVDPLLVGNEFYFMSHTGLHVFPDGGSVSNVYWNTERSFTADELNAIMDECFKHFEISGVVRDA